MSNLSFAKYHGAGNDFILIDDRAARFPSDHSALIRAMCSRRFGIGADGLILFGSVEGQFSMRIFNSDGLEASSCGNGLRCLLLFMRDLGVYHKTVQIIIGGRKAEGWLEGDQPVIELGEPSDVSLGLETPLGTLHLVNTGAPHAVRFVPDVSRINLEVEGAALRKWSGANADFASIEPDGGIRIRTFEKGVEGETLSCGTGAAAAAFAALRLFGLQGPVPVRCPGGTLSVREEEGRLFLSGPAEKVFTGTWPSLILAP